jgi:hypothetical protein
MLNPRSETNGERIMLIKKIATTLLVLFLSVSHNPGAFAAAKAGNVCTKVGTKVMPARRRLAIFLTPHSRAPD